MGKETHAFKPPTTRLSSFSWVPLEVSTSPLFKALSRTSSECFLDSAEVSV